MRGQALWSRRGTFGFGAYGGGVEFGANAQPDLPSGRHRYCQYGSVAHKQVYSYGSLDFSPTVLNRAYGMAWGVGGWLLPNFLAKAGMETAVRLRKRVADELHTTFASHYTDEISLSEALDADVVRRYNAKKTGEKFLINQGGFR